MTDGGLVVSGCKRLATSASVAIYPWLFSHATALHLLAALAWAGVITTYIECQPRGIPIDITPVMAVMPETTKFLQLLEVSLLEEGRLKAYHAIIATLLTLDDLQRKPSWPRCLKACT